MKRLLLLLGLLAGSFTALARVCPSVLPNTYPLYVYDPVPVERPGERAGFGCFGACGPSCACVRRRESTEYLRVKNVRCRYHVIQCSTNPFCRWHDRCYWLCDDAFPRHRQPRFDCYRHCDASCLTGEAPADLPGAARLGSPPVFAPGECVDLLRAALGDAARGDYDPAPMVFSELAR